MVIGEERPLLSAREVPEDGSPRDSTDATVAQDVEAYNIADDPIEWPKSFKWVVIALLSFMAFTVTFACLSIMPSANHIVRDLGHGKSNKAASVLLITVWELGEAAGPLFIAPLSETFGRYAVLNASNILFLIANVMTALSTNVSLLITMRAVTGFAVASNVLNPAIIGDMLVPEQRGKAMTVIIIVPMIASAMGPAIGGAVADGLGWRQVVWINVALACVCQIPLFAFLKETYRAPFKQDALSVQRSDADDGNATGATPQTPDGKTAMRSFWDLAIRPASILCSSRVLVMLCLCHSLDFVFYYVMVTTLPDILQDVYGQSLSSTGFTFIYFSENPFLFFSTEAEADSFIFVF
ncbi:Major facilitator superfamily domain, general substrate transporter [Akanthomyces lecanii RCEF 1005]|uniref:Major facilitator superfamily domain, general substrate transporter n=1 Tax=Akanthomyces lecanii RCEF 1005 TaxID=1081108 RepID=A0A162K4S6_CORDF|nr:Major facilitator superfamily domain, general substrate transporter [Akanthomyces lecanii RCEF 1005]